MSTPDAFLFPAAHSVDDVLSRQYQHYNLPAHCRPADEFLTRFSAFWGQCVPTYLALLSMGLGSVSLLAWLFAQLPQIYKNFRIRSTAGLSAGFLLVWCLGDTSNLVGALLTGQATWQVIIASYYTSVDCVLVGQYVYYELMGRGRKRRTVAVVDRRATKNNANGHGGSGGEREPLLGGHAANGANGDAGRRGNRKPDHEDGGPDGFKFPALVNPSPQEKDVPSSGRNMVRGTRPPGSIASSSNTLLLIACLCIALGRASPISPTPSSHPSPALHSAQVSSQSDGGEDPKELAGRIISWTSTVMYLVSRVPQLIKNYQRKSTAGLSPILFAAAFCGNLFYSSGLVANPLAWGSYGPYGYRGWAGPDGSDRTEWVVSVTPFFLGAAGVLLLDAAVGVQFLMYGEGKYGSRRDKYTPRVPVGPTTRGTTTTTTTTTGGVNGTALPGTSTPPVRSTYLAVPPGGLHGAEQQRHRDGSSMDNDGRPPEFEPASWRRVSGYMRGWVPSFSPSWTTAPGAYMRSARDKLSGFATPRSRSRSPAGRTAGDAVRDEAEAWESSRTATRQGSVDEGVVGAGGSGSGSDEDRPLLEQGQDDRYGGL